MANWGDHLMRDPMHKLSEQLMDHFMTPSTVGSWLKELKESTPAPSTIRQKLQQETDEWLADIQKITRPKKKSESVKMKAVDWAKISDLPSHDHCSMADKYRDDIARFRREMLESDFMRDELVYGNAARHTGTSASAINIERQRAKMDIDRARAMLNQHIQMEQMRLEQEYMRVQPSMMYGAKPLKPDNYFLRNLLDVT